MKKKGRRVNPCSNRVNAILAAANVAENFLTTIQGSVERVGLDQIQFGNPEWKRLLPHIIGCWDCRTAFFNHLEDRRYNLRRGR